MHKILISGYRTIFKSLSKSAVGKLYPVRLAHNLVRQLYLKHFSVKVQTHRMFLDSKDSLGLLFNDVHEPFETRLIKKEVKKGDVVLDIGANIGYYTLILAKAVGARGKVYAFEPDPKNFALLEKNVKLNGYQNIELVQKAVSDKTETIKLFLSSINKGDHRIYDSKDNRQSIEIHAIRLDEYFKSYKGKIDFVKMDIQGAEGKAFRGMRKLIKKNRKVKLISEFWPIGLKRSGIEAREYLQTLKAHGFKLFDIDEKNENIQTTSSLDLLKRFTLKNEDNGNLFCLKRN
jgi:FkbM family methyltransferase